MQINTNTKFPYHTSDPGNWLPHYPNPADFRFDYFKLLSNAPQGLAALPDGTTYSVAIVGAGSAGMTVARELLRCGFDVTIYEASNRIGGRLFTEVNPANQQSTGMEMGAMRMPFFPKPGSQNSLLEYFMLHEAGCAGHAAGYAQFPNPGTAPGATGIYLNDGFGPTNEYTEPTMITWPDNGVPDNETIQSLANKAEEFIDFFVDSIKSTYAASSDDWTALWAKIVAFYEPMTFDDLVMLPRVQIPDSSTGNLGGFGMNEQEATLLYTIGTGDGSWGAFYSISALWFIRCTMFGFGGAELQTITGLSAPESLPCYGVPTEDSLGNPLPVPRYQGIQSLVEYLYYVPAPGEEQSLHDSPSAKLYTQTSVTSITRNQSGSIVVGDTSGRKVTYDQVFVTATQLATQMSLGISGFSQEELPQTKMTAEHTQHNISSCKLFFPLREKYWTKPGNLIPQVIVTDTYIQDAYALSWDTGSGDNGVLLASYTWEDDSLKLLPFDEDKLVELVTAKLRQITIETVGQDITDYIVVDQPVSIQWITQPSYVGCAKLYRQRNEAANELDLSYNQNYGPKSNLFFTGENYGVEGGWTEPALRSAIDGVLQLLQHVGATFQVEGFDFAKDYPRWPTAS